MSRVIATLKDGLEAWRTRPLTDLDVIDVYLDGFALRVHSAGRVIRVPMLGVVGVLPDGRKRLADACQSRGQWADQVAQDRRLAEDRRGGKPAPVAGGGVTNPRVIANHVGGTAPMIKVTLLGTGTPVPAMNRFGPSILIEAGGQRLLFDAGRGAMQRLTQLKVRWQDIDGVFLTHLHSDHVVGFPDLWLTGWLVGPGRDRPLRVWGPKGTQKMMSKLEEAYDFDIRIRLYDDRAAPNGVLLFAEDINEGVAFEKGGLKITAFEVDHSPVWPAFGYRVDYGGRSVVLSGDTRMSQNLVRQAQGVDLLVHEVASPESFERARVRPERAKSIIAHHVTPEQAGEVFAKTNPKLAVYSHIVQPDASEQDLIPATRKNYAGRVEVGEDLMVIEVGEKIDVRRPARSSP